MTAGTLTPAIVAAAFDHIRGAVPGCAVELMYEGQVVEAILSKQDLSERVEYAGDNEVYAASTRSKVADWSIVPERGKLIKMGESGETPAQYLVLAVAKEPSGTMLRLDLGTQYA